MNVKLSNFSEFVGITLATKVLEQSEDMQCRKHSWDFLYNDAPENNVDLFVEALFLPLDKRVCLQCGKIGYLGGFGARQSVRHVQFRLEELIKARDWAQKSGNLSYAKKLDEHIQAYKECSTLTAHQSTL